MCLNGVGGDYACVKLLMISEMLKCCGHNVQKAAVSSATGKARAVPMETGRAGPGRTRHRLRVRASPGAEPARADAAVLAPCLAQADRTLVLPSEEFRPQSVAASVEDCLQLFVRRAALSLARAPSGSFC